MGWKTIEERREYMRDWWKKRKSDPEFLAKFKEYKTNYDKKRVAEKNKDPNFVKKWRDYGKHKQRLLRQDPEYRKRSNLMRNAKRKIQAPKAQTTAYYREAIQYFLLDKDGQNCGMCGKWMEFEDITIDHVIPVALGGLHRIENFRLAHKLCNIKAGGRLNRKYAPY